MPSVRIELKEGQTPSFIKSFMDLVHQSMVEVVKIPADDKNIRVLEYKPDFFVSKPPYEYFIEIAMFAGRSKETKSELFKTIVSKLQAVLNIEPANVFIIVNDPPKENWGLRGGISGADIQFGFKIEV